MAKVLEAPLTNLLNFFGNRPAEIAGGIPPNSKIRLELVKVRNSVVRAALPRPTWKIESTKHDKQAWERMVGGNDPSANPDGAAERAPGF